MIMHAANSLLNAPKKPARRSTAVQHHLVNPRVKRSLNFDQAAAQPEAEPHAQSALPPPTLPAQLYPPPAVASGTASRLPAMHTRKTVQQTIAVVQGTELAANKAASGASAASKASKHSLHKRKSCSRNLQQLLASEE